MLDWLKNRLKRLTRRRTAIDRRRNTKVDSQLVARVGAACWPAQVRALSTKRVRILVGRWQKQHTPISLTLCNQRTGFSCPVQGSIDQVVPCRDGMWDMRCVFQAPLNTAQLEALLQK